MNALQKISRGRAACSGQKGFTLIELIMVIVILGIALFPLLRLLSSVLVDTNSGDVLSQASFLAQSKLEKIISEKHAHGFDWVVAQYAYESETPVTGFVRTVSIDTTNMSLNQVRYALVQVSVSHSAMQDILVSTWLTDYKTASAGASGEDDESGDHDDDEDDGDEHEHGHGDGHDGEHGDENH